MTKLRSGILFHQVNCQGVMGGGIAYALARKFPGLEKAYRVFIKENCAYEYSNDGWLTKEYKTGSMLGKIHLFKACDDLYIANVFGQNDVSSRSRQTSYDATVEAFEVMEKALQEEALKGLPLYFPYKMGCGLGGGNWQIYSAIINLYFPEATICQLPT